MSNQFCTSCGHSVAMDAKFCDNCGSVFQHAGSSESAPSPGRELESSISIGTTREAVVKHARFVVGAWVMPFNATLVFGSTLVAAFDFLSPRVALLPIAATVAVLGLVAALALRKFVAPSLPEGSAFRHALAPEMGLHKSPVLIATGLLSALMVSGAAWSSAASATGGVIASKFDAARNAQMQLGVMQGLQKEQRVQTAVLEDIREGRAVDPRVAVLNLGSGWDPYSFQQALVNEDMRLINLFIEGKMKWRISSAFIAISLNKQAMVDLLLQNMPLVERLDGDCLKIVNERIVSPNPVLMYNMMDIDRSGISYKPFLYLKNEHIYFLKLFCEGTSDVASINKGYTEFKKQYEEQKKLMGGYVGPAMNESNRHLKLYQEVVGRVNKTVQ